MIPQVVNLSWRDAKCALLVFNKKRDSSAVNQKMHEVMLGRSEYRKTLPTKHPGDRSYMFVKNNDPGREISISTQIYDLAS